MSVRVNLLQAEEIQLQSAVSRDFMVRGSILLGVGVAVLGLAFVVFQYIQIRATHKRLKTQWAAMEADYTAAKGIADKHAANMAYVAELDAWASSRVEWVEPLTALQNLVPDNLQFSRLAIQSDVEISQQEPATDEYAGTPARVFAIRIEGRAEGRLSDQDVIAFVETIRESPDFSPWLEMVRLQGMQRITGAPGSDEEARSFRVNGAARERMMR